jgi:hypothetical protein
MPSFWGSGMEEKPDGIGDTKYREMKERRNGEVAK